MRLVALELHPNREIRVISCREQMVRRRERAITAISVSSESQAVSNETDDSLPVNGCSAPLVIGSKLETPPVSNEVYGHKPSPGKYRSGWGELPRRRKFSNYARRRLLRAGGALEKSVPYSHVLFLTCTIPGSTVEAFRAVAEYSAYLIHGLKAWINKRVPGKLDMYVWEWQKRGALHLHYAVYCPDRAAGEYICTNLQAQWTRLLDSVASKSGVDVWRKNRSFTHAADKSKLRVDAQWCEKSVAAYLSKYVSKSADGFRGFAFNLFCPSRWYGVSRPLSALIQKFTHKIQCRYIPSSTAKALYEDLAKAIHTHSIKSYEYRHKIGDGDTSIGYFEDLEIISVWNSLETIVMSNTHSSSNTTSSRVRFLLSGFHLMRRYPQWLETWETHSPNYVKELLSRLTPSESITALDQEFLLDSLLWSLVHTQKTRFFSQADCQLWAGKAKEFLKDATFETHCALCIPTHPVQPIKKH